MSTDQRTPRATRSEAAARLLPRFIGHRERDVTTIRSALERDDFEEISRLGHNMRGNGRSFGFPDIGDIGERMETAANIRNSEAVRVELAALEAWLETVREGGAAEEPPRAGSETRVRASGNDAGQADEIPRKG